ncbi:MAG: efflux RND transporter periplasmic adaptor subunit [Rhizobiales bacterium]|nr:efflux RND transporter periplasmic adaptor subunit [Hyphomicrobiales bacterium]
MKKSLIALILLLALGGGGYWLQKNGHLQAAWSEVSTYAGSYLKQAEKPAQPAATAQKPAAGGGRGPLPVEVAAARQAQLSDDINTIGTLLPDESVDIAAETAGRVKEILFRDGQTVEAGAILFKFDDDLIRAAYEEASSRLALAEANLKRSETLRKSGNVAQSTYDAALTEFQLMRTAVRLAEVKLDKLIIRAPFAGTLGFRLVSVGAYVDAGSALVHLDKIDRLKVSFSVPELDLVRLSTGQQVAVTADALPGETFVATVSAIDPSIDANGRALKVRADLDNSAGKLRPGLLVRVTVKGELRDTVTVPEAAIVPRGKDMIVFVAEDNTVKEAKVRTGKRTEGTVEIVDGLAAGAKVVVAGNTRLTNGAAIQIVRDEVTN